MLSFIAQRSYANRPDLIVQRGNFVIAGGCGPLEDLIPCGFADELLAGEPEDFSHVGIGFGT